MSEPMARVRLRGYRAAMGRGAGARRFAIWTLVGATLGVAIAVAPFWVGLGSGIDPKGRTCEFEDDPGSGRSRMGVERVEWSLTPTVRCLADGRAPSKWAYEENVNLPVYRELWPFAAVALTPVAWAVIFLVGLVLYGERPRVAQTPV
jgi:hypothetical protein